MSGVKTAPSAYALHTATGIAQATIALLEADHVDTDAEELRVYLREGGTDVEGMLLRLLRAAEEASALIDAASMRIAEMNDRKARFKRQQDNLRAAAQALIESLPAIFPGGKYKSAECSVSIRAGQPTPIVTDENALPQAYWRITKNIDLAGIRAALKAGATVPGVTLSNGAASLVVRMK